MIVFVFRTLLKVMPTTQEATDEFKLNNESGLKKNQAMKISAIIVTKMCM